MQTPAERGQRLERGSRPEPGATKAVKVTFVRRQPDRAQFIRRTVQVAFLLLNLWIGVRFYFMGFFLYAVLSMSATGQWATGTRPSPMRSIDHWQARRGRIETSGVYSMYIHGGRRADKNPTVGQQSGIEDSAGIR
jgi:hypothetical protein